MVRARRQCTVREVGEEEEVPHVPRVRGRAAPPPPPPPHRPRQNTKYSEEHKRYALSLLAKGVTYRRIVELTKVPRSTINRWRGDPAMVLGSGKSSRRGLTNEEELLIVIALQYLANCGTPIGRQEVATIVEGYVTQLDRPSPFINGRPGRKFLTGFERRHNTDQIRLRTPEHLAMNRAQALSTDNVQQWFDLLEYYLTEFGLKAHPEFCFNLDETALTGQPSKGKVYVNASNKNAYVIIPDTTKLSFTVMFCGNAAGIYLPPFVIYKAKNLYGNWMGEREGVPGAVYGYSDSGWMVAANFEGWFAKIFVVYVQTNCGGHKVLLTYDGHNSHITYNTVKLAIDNNIIILCLPPHTSHALQPLDVGVFKSVKAAWRLIVDKHYTSGVKIDKTNFPKLLAKLWTKLDGSHLVSGFNRTGMFPFDRHAVDAKIREAAVAPGTGFPTTYPPRSNPQKLINEIKKLWKRLWRGLWLQLQ